MFTSGAASSCNQPVKHWMHANLHARMHASWRKPRPPLSTCHAHRVFARAWVKYVMHVAFDRRVIFGVDRDLIEVGQKTMSKISWDVFSTLHVTLVGSIHVLPWFAQLCHKLPNRQCVKKSTHRKFHMNPLTQSWARLCIPY